MEVEIVAEIELVPEAWSLLTEFVIWTTMLYWNYEFKHQEQEPGREYIVNNICYFLSFSLWLIYQLEYSQKIETFLGISNRGNLAWELVAWVMDALRSQRQAMKQPEIGDGRKPLYSLG